MEYIKIPEGQMTSVSVIYKVSAVREIKVNKKPFLIVWIVSQLCFLNLNLVSLARCSSSLLI